MRLTMKNHGSYTYRASLIRADNNCALGDIVDKLGRYEDIGEPEEFEQLKCEHEKKNPPPKARFLNHQSSYSVYQIPPKKARKWRQKAAFQP